MKKLLLASAIAAAATSASALEAMSDSAMSETTGQDGLTVTLDLDSTAEVMYIDRDGVGTATNAGALIFDTTLTATALEIKVDVATDAANNSALVVGISSPNSITAEVGDITVDGISASDDWAALGDASAPIIDAFTLTIADVDAEIVLGDSAISTGSAGGTNLATLNGNVGTITVSNLGINDTNGSSETGAAGTGKLSIGEATITGLDLTGTTVDVDDNLGLVLTMGSGLNDVNIYAENINVGGAGDIGDLAITGLDLSSNVIKIQGH